METLTIPMQSATIGKLTEALSKFQGGVKQPKLNKSVSVKTRDGNSYKFQYADLSACVAAAAPSLKENGLAVIQTIQGQTLVTTLSHTSGEFINSQLPLHQQTMSSASFQSIGSMITYLKRYAYCAILGLVADEDDNANAACGNEVKYNDSAKQPETNKRGGKAGVTGSQLKGIMADINAKKSIEEVMTYYQSVVTENPELRQNEMLNGGVFQKASALGISELEKCKTADDIELLIQRWTEIWPALIEKNTPFGNAIIAKRKTLAV